MIKQTFLTEDLLIQMIIIINKYKNNVQGLKNPLSQKHPLLERNISLKLIKKFLGYYELNDLYESNSILVYKDGNNTEKPYPSGFQWISSSGRYVGVSTYDLYEHSDEMYGYFIFDMEKFEFVNFRWHDLEGIDEIRSTIYGRAIKGNYSLDTDCPHTFKTSEDGTILANTIAMSDGWNPTFLETHFINNNKLPLDDIFFLSEEVVEGETSKFIDRMNQIRLNYKEVKSIDDIVDKIIDVYQVEGKRNVYFYPLISLFARLYTLIKTNKIKSNMPFTQGDDLPF